MDNLKQIKTLVSCYQEAIHSQNKENFYQLWSQNNQCSLISITNQFIGLESIFHDFLIGRIQKAYLDIKLITENIEVNMINDYFAIVLFQYHTECIKRDSLEHYGIQGLETQIMIKEDNSWKLLHVHYSKDNR